MTFARLVAANLARNPARTTLAFVALAAGFLLLTLLRAVAAGFVTGADADDTRLMVMARYRSAYMLPVAHAERIGALDHVTAVSPVVQLLAYYQEPRNTFLQLGVAPAEYLRIMQQLEVNPAAARTFAATRAGALVTTSLAADYGWRVGDKVPLVSTVYPKQDGSALWEFEIAGTFEDASGRYPAQMLFHYDYYAEATLYNRNVVGLIAAGVDKPVNVSRVSSAIDQAFANGPQPVATHTMDYLSRNWGRQLGDFVGIARFVLGAIAFTLLLVTGHAAADAMRERRGEIATLKCLGFSDGTVAALVLGELLVLFLAAAAVGIGLAVAVEPLVNRSVAAQLGTFSIGLRQVMVVLAAALASALLVAALPCWTAWRRSAAGTAP